MAHRTPLPLQCAAKVKHYSNIPGSQLRPSRPDSDAGQSASLAPQITTHRAPIRLQTHVVGVALREESQYAMHGSGRVPRDWSNRSSHDE